MGHRGPGWQLAFQYLLEGAVAPRPIERPLLS
jgi:hypothetical protein